MLKSIRVELNAQNHEVVRQADKSESSHITTITFMLEERESHWDIPRKHEDCRYGKDIDAPLSGPRHIIAGSVETKAHVRQEGHYCGIRDSWMTGLRCQVGTY